MIVDRDKLLRRTLFLQRYVTSINNEIVETNNALDRELIASLNEFITDADDRELRAFANQRTSIESVRETLKTLKTNTRAQLDNAQAIFEREVPELVENEGAIRASALDEEKPSMLGVATLPVAGLAVSQILSTAYQRYSERLLSQVTQQATTDPDSVVSAVRGRKRERFRDGLLYWRNERLIRPNVDVIVNGVAANSATHVYRSSGVEKVDYVATLDFRTCVRCRAAEDGSPYETGKAPGIPQHPRCRCVHIPHLEDAGRFTRPYVKDSRSVKNIPRSERPGKIGQTKDTIEQFFDRMTKEQRREYMGPARATLWEQGKIDSAKQLVDERTLRPLRLDELPPI